MLFERTHENSQWDECNLSSFLFPAKWRRRQWSSCVCSGGGGAEIGAAKSSRMSVKNEKEDFSAAVNLCFFFRVCPPGPDGKWESEKEENFFLFFFLFAALNWKHNKSGEGKKMNKKKNTTQLSRDDNTAAEYSFKISFSALLPSKSSALSGQLISFHRWRKKQISVGRRLSRARLPTLILAHAPPVTLWQVNGEEKRPHRRERIFWSEKKEILYYIVGRTESREKMSTFQRLFALSLLMFVDITVGMSVPNLADCTIEYLTYHNVINASREVRLIDECDAIIKAEIDNFYANIQETIVQGVHLDDLKDDYFRLHNVCIVKHLRDFNVSDLYLKGIAYQKLDKTHKSEHTFNHKHSSQQILLMYALQVRHKQQIWKKQYNYQVQCVMCVFFLNKFKKKNSAPGLRSRELL